MSTANEARPAGGRVVNDRREIFGWMMYDWANSTFSTTVAGALLSPYLTRAIDTPVRSSTRARCRQSVRRGDRLAERSFRSRRGLATSSRSCATRARSYVYFQSGRNLRFWMPYLFLCSASLTQTFQLMLATFGATTE